MRCCCMSNSGQKTGVEVPEMPLLTISSSTVPALMSPSLTHRLSPRPLTPLLAHSRLTHCCLREVSFTFSWLLDLRMLFTYGGCLLLRSLLGLHARLAGLLMAPVLPVGDPPFQMPSHSMSLRSNLVPPATATLPPQLLFPKVPLTSAWFPSPSSSQPCPLTYWPIALSQLHGLSSLRQQWRGGQRRLLPHQPSWGAPGWAPGAGGSRESPWAGGQNAP